MESLPKRLLKIGLLSVLYLVIISVLAPQIPVAGRLILAPALAAAMYAFSRYIYPKVVGRYGKPRKPD